MSASNVQGLLRRWIGHEYPSRYVWYGRRRAFLYSYQSLPNAGASSVRTDEAGSRRFSSIIKFYSYGIIPWMNYK